MGSEESVRQEISELVEKINLFIGHLIRTQNQEARTNSVLANLAMGEGYIIFDMMMKWLPARYKEEQSDFFGLKGLSTAGITYIFKATDENAQENYQIEHYHLVSEDGQQDSFHAYSNLEAAITDFRTHHPHIRSFAGT